MLGTGGAEKRAADLGLDPGPPLDELFSIPPPPKLSGHTPTIWCGMALGPWLALLVRHRFRVSSRHWGRALLATLTAPFNSLAGGITLAVHGWRLRRVGVREPLFIVGHWRSGTTLLHELLALDRRHAWPDGYACFWPSHAFRTRPVLRRALGGGAPKRRPMDDMDFDLGLPQEDEFALMLLGLASPYESMAFPRSLPNDDSIDPARLEPRARRRYERVMRRFLASVLLGQKQRRLLLKSPIHMARLEFLSRLFPDLKVIHIVRDPRAVLPSMLRMSGTLGHALQLDHRRPPRPVEGLFANHARLFEMFEATRGLVPADRLVEIRYEDLVRDPVAVVADLYRRLDLGDFAPLAAILARRVAEGHFRLPTLPPLDAAQAAAIERWTGAVMRRYGYG